MAQLDRSSLFSLEDYSVMRPEFRTKVMAEKKHRSVSLGENIRLIFENQLTIKYQVQEMLRIEKIFEADGIAEELEAYNPLIPDGNNWKATMMIQYDDVDVRRQKLVDLKDVENQIWTQVGSSDRVLAIADEDLDRADDTKTSAVHFLRFQLPDEFIQRVQANEPISFGTNHAHYPIGQVKIDEQTRLSLASDLTGG